MDVCLSQQRQEQKREQDENDDACDAYATFAVANRTDGETDRKSMQDGTGDAGFKLRPGRYRYEQAENARRDGKIRVNRTRTRGCP